MLGPRMGICTCWRRALSTAILLLPILFTACSSFLPAKARVKLVVPLAITKHTSIDEDTRATKNSVDLVSEGFSPYFIRSGDIYYPEVELEYPLKRFPGTSLTLHIGGTRSVSANEDNVYSIVPVRIRTSTRACLFEGGAGIRHYFFQNDASKLSAIARLTGYHYRVNQSITIAGFYNYHRDLDGEGLEVDVGLGGEINNKHPWFRWLSDDLALGLDTTYSATIASDLESANRWSISACAIYSFGK